MYQAECLGEIRNASAIDASAETATNGASLVEAIKGWLIAEIAELLSVDARDLAVDEPLSNYGLSSMTGVILSGNIEEWLDLHLDAAVAWEFPTIESLAGHLATQVKDQKLSP